MAGQGRRRSAGAPVERITCGLRVCSLGAALVAATMVFSGEASAQGVAFRPQSNIQRVGYCNTCRKSRCCCESCPPSYAAPHDYYDGGAPTAPGQAAPGVPAPGAPEAAPPLGEGEPAPDVLDVAAGGGFAAAPASAAPAMIGDFFGGGRFNFVDFSGGGNTFGHPTALPIAAGDRRIKFAEMNTPIPTDRAFFYYNHFHNALPTTNDDSLNLDRFTFGLEQTFSDGLFSVELRIPFAQGLASEQVINDAADRGTEFGNVVLALKALLWQNSCYSVGAGLGLQLPTADDAAFVDGGGADILFVENESWHLQPFIGVAMTPNDRLFANVVAQLDFDANGNGVVFVGGDGSTGQYHDQNFLMLDFSVGYWVYRNPCGRVTGMAPVVELHYTTTMQDSDVVTAADGSFVENAAGRMDFLNLTGGMHFQLGACSRLTVAGVAPLREEEDRGFDAEFQVQYNRRF